MPLILWIVIVAAVAVLCFLLGILYRKKVAEREITSAEEEARRIINESIKSAESKKREALVEAKEEIHKSRSEHEREMKERRSEVQKQERRIQQKEENLDKKNDNIEKKEEQMNDGVKLLPAVFYGNQFNRIQGSMITSAPRINDFTCYRNVPCHQVCFYSTGLFKERAFKVRYTVRADYEHFLYSVFYVYILWNIYNSLSYKKT